MLSNSGIARGAVDPSKIFGLGLFSLRYDVNATSIGRGAATKSFGYWTDRQTGKVHKWPL